MLPLIVFCSYVYLGNKMTMSKMMVCDHMIHMFNGKIGHIIHHYDHWENCQLSLQKVHDFFAAYENQENVVQKVAPDSEIAVKIKGHFSRGINQDSDEKEERNKRKGCLGRKKEWVKIKLGCKKPDNGKKDDDKEEEEDDRDCVDRIVDWFKSKFSKKVEDDENDEDKKDADTKAEATKDEAKKDEDKKDEATKDGDKKDEDKKDGDKKEEEKKDEKKDDKKKDQNFDDLLTLKDLDLEIKKGEFVCIIGEVGSGKTSLLLTMLGEMLYVPQSEIDITGGSMERPLYKEERKALTYSC